MRSEQEIRADARDQRPFSNSTMGEMWMDRWCYRCKVDAAFQRDETLQGCPLLTVVVCGKTPAEWTDQGLQDYHCSEFVPDDEEDDDDKPGPDPWPQPVAEMDGQADIFAAFADQIAEQVPQREAVTV